MKKTMWVLLALVEAILALVIAKPAVVNAIMVANTRWQVLKPNFYYFMGMLAGDGLRLLVFAGLAAHAVWIVRNRLVFTVNT